MTHRPHPDQINQLNAAPLAPAAQGKSAPPTAAARRSRTNALLAAAVVLASAASVSGARLAHAADITVVEDGRATLVRTHDATVAQTLDRAGLNLAAGDRVTPALGEQLTHGDRVEVIRAKDITVLVDGRSRNATVAALTVAGARAELGVRSDAVVRASRGTDRSLAPGEKLADGTNLEVRNPQTVTLVADGRTRSLVTTAGTPAQVLAQAGLAVDGNDLVTRTRDGKPALTQLLETGDQVKLVRVSVSTQRRTVRVPAKTKTVTDPSRKVGQVVVRSKGHAGSRTTVTALTSHDGVVVSRKVVSNKLVKPATRVLVKGTKKAPAKAAPVKPAPARKPASQPASVSARSGLNWAALAQCESGGNPSAVSPGGLYRGLYQFSRVTWAAVGGAGDPAAASAAEQTKRAQILYDRAGAGQWPVCGKRL